MYRQSKNKLFLLIYPIIIKNFVRTIPVTFGCGNGYEKDLMDTT